MKGRLVLLGRWLLAVALVAASAWVFHNLREAKLDTNILALVPDEASAMLARVARSNDRLVFFQLPDQQTASTLRQQIDPSLVRWRDPQAEVATVVESFAQHRFHLLSDEDRDDLRAGRLEVIRTRILEDLGSPFSSGRLISFDADPLGFADRYTRQALQAIEFTNISGTAEYATLIGELQFNPFDLDQQLRWQNAVQAALRTLTKHDGEGLSSPTVRQGGVIVHAVASATAARGDMQRIALLSSLALIGFALWTLRRPAAPLLILAPVICGAIVGLAVTWLVFDRIHVIALIFGTTLIGLASDYAFHFLYAHAKSLQKPHALIQALALSAITTATAYGLLALGGIDALTQVAVIASCGLLAAALSVVLWFGALSTAGPLKSLTFFLPSSWRWPLLALAVITPLILALTPTFTSMELFDAAPQAQRQTSIATINAVSPIDATRLVLVYAGDSQQLLQREKTLCNALRPLQAQGAIGSLWCLAQFQPSQSEQQENHQLLAPIYANSGFFHSLGLDVYAERERQQFTRAQPFVATNPLLNNWLRTDTANVHSSQTTPAAQSLHIGVVRLQGIADESRLREVVSEFPFARYVDIGALMRGALVHLTEQSRMLTALCFAGLTLVLALCLRRGTRLWSALPLMLGASAGLASGALVSGGLGLFHWLGAILVLGIAVDYVVMLASDAIDEDSQAARSSTTASAVTTLIAFGLLATSSFPAIADLGLVVSSGTLVAWLSAAICAPDQDRGQIVR